MRLAMDGRKIESVTFPDGGILNSKHPNYPDREIILSATSHGDHDEFWILLIEGGKEINRYNPRYVESIFWEDE